MTPPAAAETSDRSHRTVAGLFGATRIVLGAIFLWAFLDKAFGLEYTTPPANAWFDGGSPTHGYLGSSFGPFADAFTAMAGDPITDLLFMLGLLGVGVALVLGIGVRVAGASGAAMMMLMYLSHPLFSAEPNGTNPLLDDHIVYALVLMAFATGAVGRRFGYGDRWAKLPIVQKNPWLV